LSFFDLPIITILAFAQCDGFIISKKKNENAFPARSRLNSDSMLQTKLKTTALQRKKTTLKSTCICKHLKLHQCCIIKQAYSIRAFGKKTDHIILCVMGIGRKGNEKWRHTFLHSFCLHCVLVGRELL